MVQDYGFATVLGEPTSDLVSGTAGMEMFALPASGLKATFTKARFVRPSGDPRPSGVVPDVRLPSPVVQTPADEVLQAALDRVRQRQTRTSVDQPRPRFGER
jgi:C-terminal processing protease CtpA/Prc